MLRGLTGDKSPGATSVREFLMAYLTNDMSNADVFFADDVVLHGVAYRARGRDAVSDCLSVFLTSAADEYTVQSVRRLNGRDSFLVLFDFLDEVRETTFPVALLLEVNREDGFISRIDECFDEENLAERQKFLQEHEEETGEVKGDDEEGSGDIHIASGGASSQHIDERGAS